MVARPPEIVIHKRPDTALRLFNSDRFRWLDEAANEGPVTRLKIGPARVFVVTDPNVARSMLINDAEHWSRPPASRFPVRLAVGDNLFTASDKVWKLVQPGVSPSFRRRALAERLSSLDAIIDTEIDALPHDINLDLDLAMGRIALIAAAWVLLGDRLGRERADAIARHQRDVIGWVAERISSPLSALPLASGRSARSMRRHSTVLSAYADEVVARRRAERGEIASDEQGDVLDALIDARPGGRPLSDSDLTSHVLGLFLAGNETTAASLSWVLVHASRHPTHWANLRTATDAVERFITETHRLTPAVWGVAHVPSKLTASKSDRTFSTSSGPVTVRRGLDAITTYTRGINRDPQRWERPAEFDPGRHLDATPEQRQSMLTFGLGPRGCIGQHLATAELNAITPRLAAYADIDIAGPAEEDPAFALRIKGGLRGMLRRPKANSTDGVDATH